MVVFIGNKNKVLTSCLYFQLSRLPFSDSGYYLDNKKDAEKLDSGYYLYVLKNVYLLSTKPTFSQLSEEITDPPPTKKKNNNNNTNNRTQLLKHCHEENREFDSVQNHITMFARALVSKVGWVWWSGWT